MRLAYPVFVDATDTSPISAGAPLRPAAYLSRIGVTDVAADPANLVVAIATAQHRRIPFENLGIHLGTPVEVDPRVIVDRLVDGRRGGICYELNGLLLLALRAFGIDAHVVGARVESAAGLGPPLGHMAVLAQVGGEPWLVDVGFGGEMVCRPIDLASVAERRIECGSAAYLLEPYTRELAEFEAMAWWHSTSPRSRFTGSLIATLPVDGGRVSITGGAEDYRLIVTDARGTRTESDLDHPAALDVCRRVLGLDVDELPSLPLGSARDRSHSGRHGVGNGNPR